MKIKNMISLLLALLLVLALGCAAAEELPGNIPSRGLSFPMTQADIDMGIEITAYNDLPDEKGNCRIFGAVVSYASPVYNQIMDEIFKQYETGDFSKYEELLYKSFPHYYNFVRFHLASNEEDVALIKEFYPDAEVLCENDGYTYLTSRDNMEIAEEDDKALIEAVEARVLELVQQVTFQPVELTELDLAVVPETEVPNAFPAFTTDLLTGGTVDSSIFAGKALTVINIWGTTCAPCVMEMPELAAWSEEMPENVQLVGLISDVVADNEEDMETAQFICESTGVNYPNWLCSEDLEEFLTGIVFTPTTIFVDRSGAIVGEPICGAYVDQYKAFVNEYLGAL